MSNPPMEMEEMEYYNLEELQQIQYYLENYLLMVQLHYFLGAVYKALCSFFILYHYIIIIKLNYLMGPAPGSLITFLPFKIKFSLSNSIDAEPLNNIFLA